MVVVGSGLNSPTLFLLSIRGSRMNWDEMRTWSQLRFILLGWSWPLVILKGGQRPLLWLSNAGIFVKLLGYLHLLPNHSVMNICTYLYYMVCITSSTAQGGGGSFKNRKPIGEVGCCESRMAERSHWWTERWLELFFGVAAMVAVVTWSVTSPTTAGCSVV